MVHYSLIHQSVNRLINCVTKLDQVLVFGVEILAMSLNTFNLASTINGVRQLINNRLSYMNNCNGWQ